MTQSGICTKFSIFIGLLAIVLLVTPNAGHAQSALIYGSVGNFDVGNNQDEDTHGFEVELEGVHPEDVSTTFNLHRYGAADVLPTPSGTLVRWTSAYDPATGFFASTVPHEPTAPLTASCYQWSGVAYDGSGCEHFGIGLRANAVRTTYRWLVEDPASPGSLIPGPKPIAVASPAYSVAAAGAAEVLNADVDAPVQTVFPTHYGDALWVKVYRTQLRREVALEELTNDNPDVVPEDPAHVEVSWTLIQADPVIKFNAGKGNRSRSRTRNGSAVSGDTRAVVRRYELYEYTGFYDPIFHQAICAVSNCAAPADGELGALVSAQMTAANVQVPSRAVAAAAPPASTAPAPTSTSRGAASVTLSIGLSNKGSVVSEDGGVRCPGTCSAKVAPGSAVRLTAVPTGGAFLKWSGACSGSETSCTVTIAKDAQVQATFSK